MIPFNTICYFNATDKQKIKWYTLLQEVRGMQKKEKVEYKINIIGDIDLEQMPQEEFDLLINFYIDGIKEYLTEQKEKANSS